MIAALALSASLMAGVQGRHDTTIRERSEHREPFVGALLVRPLRPRLALTATAIYTTTGRQLIYSGALSVKLK